MPFFGAGRKRATASAWLIHSTIRARSARLGWGAPGVANPSSYDFPQPQMPLLQGGVELVEANPRHGRVHVVA
jgi:hypothetical protein